MEKRGRPLMYNDPYHAKLREYRRQHVERVKAGLHLKIGRPRQYNDSAHVRQLQSVLRYQARKRAAGSPSTDLDAREQ